MKIFVYGTLKRGQELHYALRGQRFLGETCTLPLYRMLSLGNYPGLVQAPDPKAGCAIDGEVWEVDADCLAELDAIECVDEGEYARVPIPLHPPFSDVQVEGYLYLGEVTGLGDAGGRW